MRTSRVTASAPTPAGTSSTWVVGPKSAVQARPPGRGPKTSESRDSSTSVSSVAGGGQLELPHVMTRSASRSGPQNARGSPLSRASVGRVTSSGTPRRVCVAIVAGSGQGQSTVVVTTGSAAPKASFARVTSALYGPSPCPHPSGTASTWVRGPRSSVQAWAGACRSSIATVASSITSIAVARYGHDELP